jgi:hypothetical protein
LTTAFACFDVCPSPAAFPVVALRQMGVAFGPGPLLALVTWGLFLTALARAGAQRRLVIAVVLPMELGALFVLALAFNPPGALLPTTAEEDGVWVDKVMFACLVIIILVATMLALVPRRAPRADEQAMLKGPDRPAS